MLMIQTPFRTQFGQLWPELQKILTKDLGFLNLETEKEQLDFVKQLSKLTVTQQKKYVELLNEKQRTLGYQDNVKKFANYFRDTVKPRAKKIIREERENIRNKEQKIAEQELSKSLSDIN